jgi:hypothetical protein
VSSAVDTSDRVGAATYVYGITRGGTAVRTPGVTGARVTLIEHGGLVAVASPVGTTHLRAKRRDILAHQEVLQAVFAERPVVPLRFGTVFDDEHAVVTELLDPRRDALVGLLERLERVVELSVRAYYVEDAVLRAIVRDDPRISRLRTGRAPDVALGEAVHRALSAKRSAEGAAIERTLVRLADDAVIDPPRTEYELFRGAFLVRRNKIGAFDKAMDDLARSREGSVVFKYVGPLPPHSFVDGIA